MFQASLDEEESPVHRLEGQTWYPRKGEIFFFLKKNLKMNSRQWSISTSSQELKGADISRTH